MGYAKGDVVLVAFPFRDKAAAKVIITAVTTHPPRVPSDFPIRGWREAKLVAPSVVRLQLATITTRKILYRPGRLISDDLAKLNLLLKRALELNQEKRS